MENVQLTKRELATVLAALRFWQRHGPPQMNSFYDRLETHEQDLLDVIRTGSSRFAPVTVAEIDSLCERLNLGESVEEEPCECEQPGEFRSGVPGILAHMENGRIAQGSQIERCDLCRRYPSDEAAIEKLAELGMA